MKTGEKTEAVPGGFTRRSLTDADAPALAALLERQSPTYRRHFSALPSDAEALAKMLRAIREDLLGGYYRDGELIGIYMLRGWDEGYEVPSLGVLVDEKYRGLQAYRLMCLTVEIGKQLCRERGVTRIMYKAHPENTPARGADRLGFTRTGVDERTGHHIFHLDL